MEQLELKVTHRETQGKGAAKKLRRDGFIPGIFYGPGNEPVSITLNPKDLEKALATEYGSRVLLKLSISGLDRKKRNAMVKDIQIDPINYRWIHADLYEVNLKREVEVDVPIKLVGTPPGIKMGGIMEQIRRELTIKALPTNIPSVIEIDVSELELGDSIHVDDITAENYTIVEDSNFTLAIVSAPEAEEEVAEEEEETEEDATASEEEEETKG
ncbi:MAG: 50S ribosomal protein L25 [Nitrospiraceae bacterium]|nr:50S ribosomal protein L25 [Nitrospiraceae bacterium]